MAVLRQLVEFNGRSGAVLTSGAVTTSTAPGFRGTADKTDSRPNNTTLSIRVLLIFISSCNIPNRNKNETNNTYDL